MYCTVSDIIAYTCTHNTTGYDVCAVVSLDNKEIDSTKWSPPTNRAWEKEMKIELLQNREIEICIQSRDRENDVVALSGLLYLRLEDYFDANCTTYCLPLEPQGILLAEVTYEIPRTERRQPKLKRGRRIFKREFPRRCLIEVWVCAMLSLVSVLSNSSTIFIHLHFCSLM